MTKENPYFSLAGLCFQTPGSTLETKLNLQIAMEILQRFATDGNDQADAMAALAYLEDQDPKLQRLCDDMRIAFLLDPFEEEDRRRQIIARAYNGIAARMNHEPIAWVQGNAGPWGG